jgi:hypothetical protein
VGDFDNAGANLDWYGAVVGHDTARPELTLSKLVSVSRICADHRFANDFRTREVQRAVLQFAVRDRCARRQIVSECGGEPVPHVAKKRLNFGRLIIVDSQDDAVREQPNVHSRDAFRTTDRGAAVGHAGERRALQVRQLLRRSRSRQ